MVVGCCFVEIEAVAITQSTNCTLVITKNAIFDGDAFRGTDSRAIAIIIAGGNAIECHQTVRVNIHAGPVAAHDPAAVMAEFAVGHRDPAAAIPVIQIQAIIRIIVRFNPIHIHSTVMDSYSNSRRGG